MMRVAPLAVLTSMTLALAACSSATPAAERRPTAQASSTSSAREAPTSTVSVPPAGGASSPPVSTPTASVLPTRRAAPVAYRSEVVHRGADHPDDLLIDASGALLYSDYTNGTISRLEPDGSGTVLHRGIDGPEGMVLLPDGSLVVAEENTNRLLVFAPGQAHAAVFATLPGRAQKVTCHEGVDGIAWDPTTQTVVVPDAVTGTIYRIRPDGTTASTIGRGFVHPVGAAVGPDGSVYVADECGGDVWRLGRAGKGTAVASASMPDDVALDGYGNIIVTDVRHINHDVRRWPLSGGTSTVLARSGLVEPQGLAIDRSGRIYISDDLARVILRLTPTG